MAFFFKCPRPEPCWNLTSFIQKRAVEITWDQWCVGSNGTAVARRRESGGGMRGATEDVAMVIHQHSAGVTEPGRSTTLSHSHASAFRTARTKQLHIRQSTNLHWSAATIKTGFWPNRWYAVFLKIEKCFRHSLGLLAVISLTYKLWIMICPFTADFSKILWVLRRNTINKYKIFGELFQNKESKDKMNCSLVLNR